MKTVPFRVVVTSLFLALTLTAVNAQTTYTLDAPASFGTRGDGSIQPDDSIGTNPQSGNDIKISAPGGHGIQSGDSTAAPISTNGFNMRGLTYDPISGNLIFVDTHTGSGGAQVMPPNSAIYILDSNTGQILSALNTNGIINDTGGIGCAVTVGVGDDGAVYVANQINNASLGNFKIYRWPTANPSAPNFNEAPTVAFSNKLEISERLAQTIDVRGAGTNTQIIVGSSASNGPGTNCWIFTTIDGTNFVQHRIYFPGITTPNFNDGIAFGVGNTFFAKQVGKPLLVLSYDPVTYTGSVITSWTPSSPSDPLLNISGITYDPATKLLGGLEEIGGTATGGPGNVWLFDFFDPTNHAPAVLASRTYTPNFQKTTAPMGYLRFGAGKLYAHVSNNGFLVSLVDSTFLDAPTFTINLPATNKVPTTLNAHFEVHAVYDVTNYQWFSNNVPIAGATTYYYDIPNVQPSMDNSVFKVIAYNANSSVTSTSCKLKIVDPSSFFHLTPLWSAIGGATNYISANGGSGTPKERAIAYNPLSNQLLVVRGVASTVPTVFVVNASTGAYLYSLKTNNVIGGQTLTLAGIGVADDGAVYACNVASDTSFRIYRWADSGSNTIAQVIYGTNSASGQYNPMGDFLGNVFFRFGDNMAVRGSGINTELVLDSQNSTKYVSIITPVDSTMTNWTSTGSLLQNIQGSYGSQAYGTTIGRSLQFGQTSGTFWQKRYNAAAGAPVAQMSYSSGGGLAPLVVANNSLPIFTNGPVGINFGLSLAAAINFVGSVGSSSTQPDMLSYYDFSNPSQSVILNQVNLAGSNSGGHTANGNAIGQVIFGVNAVTQSNYLFVINGNNAINAYALEGGAVPPPTVLIQPHPVRLLIGSSNNLSVTVDQPCNITWYKGTNPAVNTGVVGTIYSFPNAQLGDSGDYFATAFNGNGATTSLVAHVTVSDASQFPTLSTVWAAGAGNSSFPYVTSSGGANTPNERAFAYNPVANQLVVVRCPPASTSYALSVVDANTGNFLYTMNTTGVIHEGTSEVSGSNPIDLVGAACADDGALYISSESPNASGGVNGDTTKMMHIFRWPDTTASSTPTLVYEGDPGNQPTTVNIRWGDVLAARGAGTNTELFMNAFDGTFGAILSPTNSALSGFTNYPFSEVAGGGSIGRSIQFGPGASVYEKRRGNSLIYSTYTLSNQTAQLVYNSPSSTTLGGVAIDSTQTLAAGVDFIGAANSKPDVVSLYDITDPVSPLLLGQYAFPSNQVANANSICQTLIVGSRVYALDANNGMVTFNIVPAASSNPPALTIVLSGSNVIVSWPQQGSYTLQSVANLTSPIGWGDLSTGTPANGRYVVTNSISSQATFYRLRQ